MHPFFCYNFSGAAQIHALAAPYKAQHFSRIIFFDDNAAPTGLG